MNAVDSSVAIAALATWHEAHETCAAAVNPGAHLPAHAAAETYSVLTRLRDPFRTSANVARQLIVEAFGDSILALSADSYRRLIDVAPSIGITGGAIYDAVIGATAKEADVTLLTRDARATSIYDALGVRWALVS